MRTKWKVVGPLAIAITFVAAFIAMAKVSAQAGPSGTLNLDVTNSAGREVTVSGSFSGSAKSWGACIDWGHDGLSVCYDTPSGDFSEKHVFPAGSVYTVTLSVQGANTVYTETERVVFEDPRPAGSVTATVSDVIHQIATVSGDFENSSDWGACIKNWGHTGESNSEVCFPGTNGSFVVEHVWPHPGEFVITYEVKGLSEAAVYTTTVEFQRAYIPALFR